MRKGLAKAVVFLSLALGTVSLLLGFLQPRKSSSISEETVAEVSPDPSQEDTSLGTTEAVPSGAVSSLEEVQGAVVQIQAEGTFVDPEIGTYVGAGHGSGFIIDPSGIAVTNNHVVTGAALLKVWIGGDANITYNAKVLGVSECSDLAVIDIDGENFPYLEWFSEDITTGLDIYVAGYPLGEKYYTLLDGSISKGKADGETPWASVDSVIEHTALTNPGNSGGPVVTKDGKLIAIHYAGDPKHEQHYAIARDEAKPIIQQLRNGNDVDTIGLNGRPVMFKLKGNNITGIWVNSVESGSTADKTGIDGGDILLYLEDHPLATDGTMSEYCDIIRTHTPGDVLDVTVLRFATEQFLEGQLNGRELTPSN